jgi:hypothetical protein
MKASHLPKFARSEPNRELRDPGIYGRMVVQVESEYQPNTVYPIPLPDLSPIISSI